MRSGSLVSCITLFTCGLFLVAVDGRSTMREMPPTPPPIERIPRFHDTSDLTTRSMRAANAAGLNRRRSNPEAMHFGVARMTLTSNNQVPSNFSSLHSAIYSVLCRVLLLSFHVLFLRIRDILLADISLFFEIQYLNNTFTLTWFALTVPAFPTYPIMLMLTIVYFQCR